MGLSTSWALRGYFVAFRSSIGRRVAGMYLVQRSVRQEVNLKGNMEGFVAFRIFIGRSWRLTGLGGEMWLKVATSVVFGRKIVLLRFVTFVGRFDMKCCELVREFGKRVDSSAEMKLLDFRVRERNSTISKI